MASNDASEGTAAAEETGRESLPIRLVRPQSDDSGQLMHWEAVKKLRISHVDPEKPIHMRQVEIYGCDGINHALASNGGVASQSSMMGDGENWGPAHLAIDGNREGRVNHTAHEANGWFEVNLAKAVDVESFAICNMIDDEHDHRLRMSGHLVELLDDRERVVYSHRMDPAIDIHLFDPKVSCRQRWVNEEAQLVYATLELTPGDEEKLAKVTPVKISGEPLGPGVSLDIEAPKAAAVLCEEIAQQTRVPSYRLRLMLPDGRILRQHPPEGEGDATASLLELVPEIKTEMKRRMLARSASRDYVKELVPKCM